MPRIYHCKHGCGFHRSRKAQVLSHEELCKFGILDRVIAENQLLKDKLSEQDVMLKTCFESIDTLTKQVAGLMRRKRRDDANDAIYNFNWKKDFRFDAAFFEKLTKDASNMNSMMDTMIQHYFERTPVFYKLGNQKIKLEVKGVIGVIKRQPVGIDNVLTTIPFTRFYAVVIDMLVDELLEHHITVALDTDSNIEHDEKLESRLRETLNLLHYHPKLSDARHNKLYRICRSRTIDIMYTAMKKRIKKDKTLTL